MKKRLLSAALALAMVLTMLPLTVFAADEAPAADQHSPEDGVTTVNYYTSELAGSKNNSGHGKNAWYMSKTVDGKTIYSVVNNGVVATSATGTNGKWFSSIDNAVGPTTEKVSEAEGAAAKGNASAVRIIGGGSLSIDLSKANPNGITIELNGQTLTLTGNLQQNQAKTEENPNPVNTKLTSLTLVSNKKENGETVKGTVNGSITALAQNFTLNMTDVDGSGVSAVSLSNTATNSHKLTIKLTRSKLGNVNTTFVASDITVSDESTIGILTLNGTKAETTTQYTQKVTASSAKEKNTIGAITVNGNSSTVNLASTTVSGAIDVTGNNSTVSLTDTGVSNVSFTGINTGTSTTNISATGTSSLGDVTIFGATKDKDDKVPTGYGPKVSLTGGAEATSIKSAAGKGAEEKSATVTTTGSKVTGDIDIAMGAVTVSGGSVGGAVKVKSGSLELKEGASVGSVELAANGNTKLTVSSSSNPNAVQTTVAGNVTKATSDKAVTLDVKGGVFGGEFLKGYDYKGHGVSGGTFTSELGRDFLANNLAYQIKTTGTDPATYTYTSNFQDLVDAFKANLTDKGELKEEGSRQVTASVVNLGSSFGKITFNVNEKPVLILNVTKNGAITLPVTVNGSSTPAWYVQGIATPLTGSYVVANDEVILGTTVATDSSSITEVSADKGIKAELSGSTIKLSGAMTDYGTTINLKIKTEDLPKNMPEGYDAIIAYTYDYTSNKEIVAFTKGIPGSIIAGNTMNFNGITYTLDGSGLGIKVETLDITGVNLTASGTKAATKPGTIQFNGSTAGTRKEWEDALKTGTDVDFSGSPAVKNAVSVVAAGITQANVKSWLDQANTAEWKKKHDNKAPTAEELSGASYYTRITLEVYLEVSVTGWTAIGGGTQADTLKLNLTPKYSIYAQGGGDIEDFPINGKTAQTLALSGDMGEVEVKVNLPSRVGMPTGAGKIWAHHDASGSRVYKAEYASSVLTFKTADGFSPYIIDGIAPAVTRTHTKEDKTEEETYYDSLQAAVNDTEHEDVLTLGANYSGATTVSVTGKARTFSVVRGTGNGGVALTFNGATKVTTAQADGTYTVVLERDNVVPPASITVSTVANGSMTASTSSAVAGTVVTLTAKPNENYRADAPTVRTNSGASVTLTASTTATGVWTFTVPTGATSITVTPVFTLVSGLPFTDVSATAWYYEGVAYCYNTTTSNGVKLMQGYNDTTFGIGTNHPLTRADVVTIMWNLKGRPAAGATTEKSTFSDVKSGEWYYSAVTWAANNGYANGYGDGRFGPNDPVLRDELVTFLWRFAGSPKMTTNLSAYTDGGKVLDWAQDAMRWAAGLNILSGTSSVALNGTLSPRTVAYREQVAVTVWHYHLRYK